MKIRDIATMKIESAEPTDLIVEVARKMQRADVGFIPVVNRGTPIGVITDRDIALRGVAEGKNPATLQAQDIMTTHVHWIHDDEKAEDAAWMMVNNNVRRLLVMNRQGHPVGVVSLDDLAFFTNGNETTGRILNTLAEKHRPQAEFAAN